MRAPRGPTLAVTGRLADVQAGIGRASQEATGTSSSSVTTRGSPSSEQPTRPTGRRRGRRTADRPWPPAFSSVDRHRAGPGAATVQVGVSLDTRPHLSGHVDRDDRDNVPDDPPDGPRASFRRSPARRRNFTDRSVRRRLPVGAGSRRRGPSRQCWSAFRSLSEQSGQSMLLPALGGVILIMAGAPSRGSFCDSLGGGPGAYL